MSAGPGEARVLKVLEEYLAELRAGRAPDRTALLALHPDLAHSLAASFRALDFVHDAGRTLEAPEAADPPGRDEPPSAGRTLGDYRLLREIGRGGMAVVYEAEQVSLGRHVALKVLPFAAVLDPKHLQRFKNEAQAAAHLHHPHIVPVHAVGCERGVHYYAMQYVEGQSLAVAIRDMKGGGAGEGTRTPISSHGSNREPAYVRMAATLGVQAAEALDHAHQFGIVHRDVKPGNLLVDLAGTLWITDFGLSHSLKDVGLTMTGELLGTIRYMSPEQALAKRVPIDHRTDVYSLGATLYELFTLEPAFPGDDPHLVIQDIAFKEPVLPRRLNPALPRDLETVILKAISKDPASRYATAQEMADDLRRYLENRPIEAKRPGPFKRVAKWSRRHRALVGTAAGVLLLAVAGLAIGTALLWREKERTGTAFDRAEANLALALKALDQIYVDEARVHPEIREGLPRDLLERGLGFYEEFARENAYSQHVARWMGNAHLNAGRIFLELGQKVRAKEALDTAISTIREAIRLKPDDADMHFGLSIAFLDKGDTDGAIASSREAIRLKPDLMRAHCILGTALLGKADHEGAIAAYREAIRLEPDFADAHCNLGCGLSAKGDMDGAIAAYREAIRLKPDLTIAHSNLGGALKTKGDMDGAIAAYREAIRLEPDHATANHLLGNALKDMGDVDGAIASHREAIRLQPDSPAAHNNLGLLLLGKGDTDGAIREARETIRLAPDDVRSHFNLGNALLAKGDMDGAIASLREAIGLKPDYAEVHCNLGKALLDKGDMGGAIASFREAIRLEPNLANAHSNLGAVLSAKGDKDGAIASFREAIRLEPDLAMAHFNLGQALLAKSDPDGAIASCREAIRLEPDLAIAHCNLGKALCDKGDPDGAIASFREAIRLEPDLAWTHFNVGYVLSDMGDVDGAIASYREAIRLQPDDAAPHNNHGLLLLGMGDTDAHNNLGVLLLDKGDTDGAIREHREAIRLKPDDFASHFHLGNALKATGDIQGAAASYREAMRLKPDDFLPHFNLGNALLDTGDIQGAAASYREAIRLKPDYAESHYALGNTLSNGGDLECAIEAYREAIRIRPDYAEAHCNLGHTLMRQGHFREALPWLRKGHELGSMRPDWDYPSGKWIESAERKAELEGRLDQVFSGGERPRDALDRIAFAELLYAKSRHAESARMYAEAFAEDAALAEDHRYNAAFTAALAAARGGADAADWRGRALEWLRADLAAHEKAPSGLVATLEHWKQDPDLAAVRDCLDELPKPECEAWQRLWAAVDEALATARQASR